MAKFARGARALGECDRCGFTYKLSELRREIVNLQTTYNRVCPNCWSPDHPQLQVGKKPVVDVESLRDPRPDRRPADLTNIRWGWMPVYALESTCNVGTVNVETP